MKPKLAGILATAIALGALTLATDAYLDDGCAHAGLDKIRDQLK